MSSKTLTQEEFSKWLALCIAYSVEECYEFCLIADDEKMKTVMEAFGELPPDSFDRIMKVLNSGVKDWDEVIGSMKDGQEQY